jgi:hypothetical protein
MCMCGRRTKVWGSDGRRATCMIWLDWGGGGSVGEVGGMKQMLAKTVCGLRV